MNLCNANTVKYAKPSKKQSFRGASVYVAILRDSIPLDGGRQAPHFLLIMIESVKLPIYHGDTLRAAVESASEERNALVEGLIYENSINMWFGNDGVGKSVLALQSALQASAGEPVFGTFDCVRPLNIVYVIAERHISEPIERIKKMIEQVKWEPGNLLLIDDLQGLNLQVPKQAETAFNKIMDKVSVFREKVDLIYLDPIYAMTGGKLKDDEGVSHINDFSRKLSVTLGCADLMLHHENRGTRDQATGKRSQADMYGNKFLSAHCTAVFHIHKTDIGSRFERLKDSYGVLPEQFNLEFNAEIYISQITSDGILISKQGLIDGFINNCYNKGIKYTLNDMVKACPNVSLIYQRKMIYQRIISGNILAHKTNGKANLYETIRRVDTKPP